MPDDNVIKIEFAGGGPGSGSKGTGNGGSSSGNRGGGSSQGVNIDEILAAHRIRVEAEKRSEANRYAQKMAQSKAAGTAQAAADAEAIANQKNRETERVGELTRSNQLERQIEAADHAAARKKADKVKQQQTRAAQAVNDTRQKIQTAGIGGVQIATGQGASAKINGLLTVAGSGMMGGEAAALAGGPVGAAIMAGLMVKDAISKTISGAAQAATATGASIIGGSPGQAMGGIANKLGDAISFIGGPQAQIAVEGARAAVDLSKAAIERGKEVSMYNSEIGGAMARADNRTMMYDIRDAQKHGGSYSSMIDSQSRLEETGRRLLEPIKDVLLKQLEIFMRNMADTADWVDRQTEWNSEESARKRKEEADKANEVLLGGLAFAIKDLDNPNNVQKRDGVAWFAQIPMQFQQGK